MSIDFSDIIAALDDDPFVEYPVDVRTFTTSPDYLGQPALSEIQYTIVEASSQIYKEADLARFMSKQEAKDHYRKYTHGEVILMCGKGSGKDFVSTIACAYIVYKLLCLKDPARYFGKPPDDAIDIMNIAVNAEQAKNVFFKNFKTKIEKSPWFAGKYVPKISQIEFDKSITVYSGHSERESHEGLNLILAILDEISGFAMSSSTGNLAAKTSGAIYDAFRGTIDSRFPDFGKVVLLSFPRHRDDFITQRYDAVVAEKQVIKRVHEFIINPELSADYPGNRLEIEWDEDHIISYREPNVYAIKRPTWDVNPTRKIEDFKSAFARNMIDALQRFACMPTDMIDTFFRDKEKAQRAMSLRNPIDERRRFDPAYSADPSKLYYAHVDLAQLVDKCAVAVSHVEKWVFIKSFADYEQVVPIVVTDVIAWWEPRTEGPVDFREVKEWIINLRRKGFDLRVVTFDRWHSHDIQRDLNDVGIATDVLSVARKHYEDLAMILYEDRITAPAIPLLFDELTALKVMDNGKIDHPRKGSKDLCDAWAGSVYNAISLTPRILEDTIEVHDFSTSKSMRQIEAEKDAVLDKRKEMSAEIKDFLAGARLL